VRFRIGSTVVYPAHGTAKVVGRSTRKVDGEDVAYLELEVAGDDNARTSSVMRLSVPEERAEPIGVRPVIGADEADEVLAVLAARNVRVPTNWSRRFKNHQEKLKSGDIYELAEVVRNLAVRADTSAGGLSTAEKAMQERARRILASELAVSWGVSYDEATARMDAAAHGTA
jgi:CarD family transcriptional regulator